MSSELFNTLNLHDSTLLQVTVVRGCEDDRIVMRLDYIGDYETMNTSAKLLVFSGCVEANLKMDFFIAAPETLLACTIVDPSAIMEERRAMLASFGVELDNLVRHFRIETTGSNYDILAKKVELQVPT